VVAVWAAAVFTRAHWLNHHATLADWSVAFATGSLALFTYALAREAKGQLVLGQQQLIAAQRPMVLPVVDGSWEYARSVLRLQNVGAGPAYNLGGALYWRQGPQDHGNLVPLAIGPHELIDAHLVEKVDVNWASATGFLRYHDLSNIEWQTHFRFKGDQARHYFVEIVYVGQSNSLPEPMYTQHGWQNPPTEVRQRQLREVKVGRLESGGEAE
jgi:hypothetical protein